MGMRLHTEAAKGVWEVGELGVQCVVEWGQVGWGGWGVGVWGEGRVPSLSRTRPSMDADMSPMP
jgi:hypothetical protein